MKLPDHLDFNQSNLQDYVDCPYRFYLRHILRTKWPALVVDDAIAFEQRGQTGARFHRLIQQYLIGVPEHRLTDLAEADPEADVAHWWDGFLAHVPPWLAGKRFVETTLSASLAGRRLVAKTDLILVQDDGQLVIFDWKTSSRAIKKSWLLERVQTRLYRYVLACSAQSLTGHPKTPPESITMNYWFAPFPDTPVRLPYDAESFDADQTFFEELIREIQARQPEDFFKTTDERRCRFCVYRSHCDRGVEAGDLDSFEAASFAEPEETFTLDFDEIAEIAF